MLQASFAKLKLKTTLMDLPNELIEKILVMALYEKCRYSSSVCHDFKFVVTLTRINKRCSRILNNTWDFRDLKVFYRAASNVKAQSQFYPNVCILVADHFFPKKMVKLASGLSKHHPVLFRVSTVLTRKAMNDCLDQFSRFLCTINGSKSIAIAGIELSRHPYRIRNPQDPGILDMFDDIVKQLKIQSTVRDKFYVTVID